MFARGGGPRVCAGGCRVKPQRERGEGRDEDPGEGGGSTHGCSSVHRRQADTEAE